MADFEKFTQIQSEIDENRDAYNKINKEYLDLVKLYGKCMAATDNAIENIVKLPTDSEGWKLWKNRLKTRRSLELTKFNQELILYDKRMEVFATFSKAFNRQYDPSQFQKINLLALKQADEIPDEVPDMRPTSPIEIISDESVNEIPHPYYWNDPNQMDIMQPTTSANAKAIYEAQKLNRKSQLPQSKLPQRPKTPKTSTVSTPRRSPPKFEDQLSSTTNNFKSTPKSKLRQPNFHSSKSPKFQSEIPRKAPSFNISSSKTSKSSSKVRDHNVSKIARLVDQISSKIKEPVPEHMQGKCNDILSSFFSEIQSRQLENLDCGTILRQPTTKRKNILLKQLKNSLKSYQDELRKELKSK